MNELQRCKTQNARTTENKTWNIEIAAGQNQFDLLNECKRRFGFVLH